MQKIIPAFRRTELLLILICCQSGTGGWNGGLVGVEAAIITPVESLVDALIDVVPAHDTVFQDFLDLLNAAALCLSHDLAF